MVKYFCSVDRGTVVSCDKDEENVSIVDNFYLDYVYYVPEDGEWVYTKKDGSKCRKSVTKGTLVLKMYPISEGSDREYFFIETDELKDHYNRILENRKKEEERADSCKLEPVYDC